MKITLQKRLEFNGKAVTKQIVIELPDNAPIEEVSDAMLKVIRDGQWFIVEDVA